MELLDPRRLGLVISGTKRGKSVFLSSNLAESLESLNSQLADIRSFASFQRGDHEYYCFDFNSNFKAISIIYTLNDALGRIGYLEITLVIPQNKTFAEGRNNGLSLLKQLLETYMSRYVVAEFVTKTINPAIREDVTVFESVLDEYYTELVQADYPNISKSSGTCYLKYKDEADLNQVFENYDREELRNFEKVFVMPDVANDLTANVSFTELPPVQKKVKLTIRTFTRGSDDMLFNV